MKEKRLNLISIQLKISWSYSRI